MGKFLSNAQKHTVEPVYYGHLKTGKKCPNYQGALIFQVVLYEKDLNRVSGLCRFP